MKPPDEGTREKILIYGPPKVGKTTAWLSVARLAHKTGSNAQFYVVDTDDAVYRMLASHAYSNIRERIHVLPAHEWPDYVEARNYIRENAEEKDWVIVDLADKPWTAVQDYYLQEVLGESIDEYVLRKKKELKEQGKSGKKHQLLLYQDIDWTVVKSLYHSFFKSILLGGSFHVLLATEQKEIWDQGESKTSKQMFARHGVKPAGEKSLPHTVHSIIHLDRAARGRTMTTMGDREREEVDGETYKDFAMSYLVKRAGWRLK